MYGEFNTLIIETREDVSGGAIIAKCGSFLPRPRPEVTRGGSTNRILDNIFKMPIFKSKFNFFEILKANMVKHPERVMAI